MDQSTAILLQSFVGMPSAPAHWLKSGASGAAAADSSLPKRLQTHNILMRMNHAVEGTILPPLSNQIPAEYRFSFLSTRHRGQPSLARIRQRSREYQQRPQCSMRSRHTTQPPESPQLHCTLLLTCHQEKILILST